MRIDIVTLFPEVFGPLMSSIPAKAQDIGALDLRLHWLRQWGVGPQLQVDDTPFGGGPGMVLKPEPFFACLDTIVSQTELRPWIVFPTPVGRPFNQATARRLAQQNHLVFLCGHYEGIDERVVDHWVDEELSLGDYVLSSGELATMVMADAVVRLLPGVIKQESYQQDSFFSARLDHPHFTKPASFRGLDVPDVLLSGHHKKIQDWQQQQSLVRTQTRRPDLVGSQLGIGQTGSDPPGTAPSTQERTNHD